MKDGTMDNFSPELRIFGLDDVTVVVFDTLSAIDKTRAARTVYLPKNIKQLSFRLEGFNTESKVDLGDRRTITGKIILVGTDDAGAKDYELAAPTFVLAAIGKANKDGTFNFATIDEVEYNVRQGVSDALIGAVGDYFAAASAPPAASAAQASYPVLTPIGAQSQGSAVVSARVRGVAAANDEKKSYRRKMAFAILGAPLLIWFVAWGGSHLLRPANPIEDAVAKAMRQDPSSVQAQVELTKQTLQQMGLDPGQSGDIGCLTAKQ